ncbi:uncharacterized protein LOC128275305 [Anopheles cruzii]|uniref:uncharacterized protein LOC128275305 n=1 Tax=Anopheles cruzii TaxID=68878 RepID=UPI0022EC1A16|nr:uncharacterized protein LOC128275305 [Anopheles cruzii]
MWTPSYDIIVETLTGSEFEVTVNDMDTVGYIKSKIQKYEGIPVSQQHLLYKHTELTDAMVMKDIPLVNGSRLKLVLGLKGGPISSKRLVTISSDCDNWLDMSDVLSGEDLMNLQSPRLKLLFYKDNKKNVHRLMKVRAEKAGDGMKSSISRSVIGSGVAGQAGHGSGTGAGGGSGSGQMSQKERDIAVTKEKLAQIKAKLSQKKKRLNGGGGAPVNGGETTGHDGADVHDATRQTATTMVSLRSGCDLMNEIDLSNAYRYRHKKRHNQHYHHHHHHHHQQHQQHLETVIKEEKCPIGYHRPTTGYDGSLHASGAAGTASGHRKSMPAVIDFGRQKTDASTTVPSFNYGLVNVLHGGGSGGGAASAASARRTHTASSLEQEKRSQIREHLQRNRSFKTISAKSLDFGRDAAAAALHLSHHGPSAGLERSLSFHSNGILNRMDSELGGGGRRSSGRLGAASTGSISASQARLDGRGRVGLGGGGGCTTQSLRQLDEKVSSASLHDLIDLLNFTPSRKHHRTYSNDALNKLLVGGASNGGVGGCPKKYGAAGAMGKKSLPDINPPALNNIDEYIADYDIGMKASSGGTAATTVGASAAELAFKSGAHAAVGDKTAFRALYKSTSDGGTVYELPKLLVREDSPVESFLASYSQLETVATVRGDSTGSGLEQSSSDHTGGTTANLSDSLLEVNLPHGATPSTAGTIGDVTAKAKLASESLLKLAAEVAAECRSAASARCPPAPSTISPPPGATLFGSNGSLISTPGPSKAPLMSGGGSCSSSWCHHWNNRQSASYSYGPSVGRAAHSELGINELELKFVRNNDRVATIERVELLTAAAANGDQCGPACDGSNHAVGHTSDSRNVIKLPALSGLEINTGGGWLQMTAADALRFGGGDDLGDEDDDDDQEEEEDDDDDEDDGDNEDEEHDGDDDFGDEEGDLVGGHQVVRDDGDEADGGREERISSSSCSSIRRPRATSNSTSFIHSHLSISSDEDDLFSVAELGGGAGGAAASTGYRAAVGSKSKSIDLNEFRKAFGSSPTLLNAALGTGTSVGRLVPPQLSRLETIPSQYRRGYTNLNDACLSSSTSELECVSNGAAAAAKKKLTTLLAPDGTSELSPLLKHRASNEHIAYVRSNENLNRYKALFAATPSSSSSSSGGGGGGGDGSARRRSSENGETVGGGGDALYLRHQRQSHGSASGARHLHGIRDHLAAIADSAEMLGDSMHGSGDGSTDGSNLADDDLGRCFTVGGDFECRFSRLSCCSVASGGGTVDKSVSPRGSADGSRLVTGGGGSDGAMRTDSGTVDDRNRLLFGGGGGTVLDGGNGSSTPLRRQSDYYFPSDESLFNMDSFFDDFVEIDTSDIFDSAEFINISAPPLSHHRHLAQQNHHPQQQQQHHHHHHHHHHLGTRKSVSSSGLLLPDILHQQQQQPQQQQQQAQQQPQHAHQGHGHYQYLLSKDHQQHGPLRLNTADRDGDGIHFSASRRIAQMHQHHHGPRGPPADDIDLDDEPGIASIIQHIDREQLCDRGATTTLPPATINSRSVGSNNHNNGLGDRIATERLLRLPPRSDLGLFGSAGAVLTFPAEPLTDRARDGDDREGVAGHQQHHATEQIKSKKLRCAQCNKKLGVIMIMKCHCEKIFCAQHRYAEAHNCSYDFKLQGRKLLERENPLVVAEKLPKI